MTANRNFDLPLPGQGARHLMVLPLLFPILHMALVFFVDYEAPLRVNVRDQLNNPNVKHDAFCIRCNLARKSQRDNNAANFRQRLPTPN